MKNDYQQKPPIGVMDKNIYLEFLKDAIELNGGMCPTQIRRSRMESLKGAISRYVEAKLPIDVEWAIEYNELLKESGIVPNEFKL